MTGDYELLGKHLDYLKELKTQSESFRKTSPENKIKKLEEIIEKKSKFETALALKNIGFDEFDSMIFFLISKAAKESPENYYRIRMGFPDYVEIWEQLKHSAWSADHNTDKFFRKFELN
ncbi:MAG: hypothetical protein EBS06_05310 [Proteobacteria bacterium]|nr:hypothetical protein [Pseudomonadota bacterium]